MTIRTVDLSGRYEIDNVSAVRISLVTPALINPNWLHGDLAVGGTTGYAQNITMLRSSADAAVDLSGQYTVLAVTADTLTLDSPEAVNADWNTLVDYPGGSTPGLSGYVAVAGVTNWIGPYIVEDPTTEFLVVNVLAPQGAYKTDSDQQLASDVQFVVQATPVDQDDVPIGAVQEFTGTVLGSIESKDQRAVTLVCPLAVPGRQSVRAKRVTLADYDFDGVVVDEIKWQDLYGMGPVDQPDFGNVTTVRTRTFATQGALNVKERKLNMLVTRKVPHWEGGEAFSDPAASNAASDIFVEICRDPTLGNRAVSELDLDSIYGAIDLAGSYFGDLEATVFAYTFDDDNTSFEEMAIAVAGAAFSVPYRQGSQIRLFFEAPTDNSVMLFNHRNKIPGSETRTVRFGPMADNDGIELEYVSPDDDKPATIYIPADKSAKKPRKIEAHGVRSHKQAYWLAWRAFNKMHYQNAVVEFTGLQEAAPLVRNERLLIADNTRSDTQDGEVEDQVGLQLTLSQDVDLSDPDGYTIFIQLPDATVQSIPITAGDAANQVVLGEAPALALALDPNLYARATYQIVANSSPRSSAFLLSEKNPQDDGTFAIQAVNYTGLYYLNDGLQLWLQFLFANHYDSSPNHHDGIPIGGAATVFDADRDKLVHLGAGAGSMVTFEAFDPPPDSYSKAAWINVDTSVESDILANAYGGPEGFRVQGVVRAGHFGADDVLAVYPDDDLWHHVAVTYDAAATRMALYLDGELVDENDAVANRVPAQLNAFENMTGRADYLMLWSRALNASDVRDIYKVTKIVG